MSRETLLAELNRLLDAGEPLLTVFPSVFPKKHPDGWSLKLPDNISDEMRWYVEDVAWRAHNREGYKDFCQQAAIDYLVGLVERRKVGLLGWRAIGVLK